MSPRLVIWDVDGTLIDSAGDIAAVMALAFADEDLAAPGPEAVRAIIGLTLEVAIDRLHPGLGEARVARLTRGYKAHFHSRREEIGVAGAPLFPGIRAVLEGLAAESDMRLAIATGKSRASLGPILAGHGLSGMFHSVQVSDDHPSKPHPAMVLAALAETGAAPATTVMVGDTSFDIDMARAAGVRALGVAWGYHPVEGLGADAVAQETGDLAGLLARLTTGGRHG
ncbi:MAG: HAD-IA family hydrolase [Rubellimicrobium sp.]|nr:HAD-IA family hydrolase [Rubellimicrobium sp.]